MGEGRDGRPGGRARDCRPWMARMPKWMLALPCTAGLQPAFHGNRPGAHELALCVWRYLRRGSQRWGLVPWSHVGAPR